MGVRGKNVVPLGVKLRRFDDLCWVERRGIPPDRQSVLTGATSEPYSVHSAVWHRLFGCCAATALGRGSSRTEGGRKSQHMRRVAGLRAEHAALAGSYSSVVSYLLKGCGHSTSVGAFFPGPNHVNHRYLSTTRAMVASIEQQEAARVKAARLGCHKGLGRGWRGRVEGSISRTYMANGIASGDQRNAGIRNQPQMPDMKDTM